MNPYDLLVELNRRDVSVWAEGTRLKVRAQRGALTPALREALAQHKPEILAALRMAGRSANDDTPAAANAPTLSSGQRRMWFLDRVGAQPAAHNLVYGIRSKKRLDVAALQRVADALVDRHEILRTAIGAPDGEPRAINDPATKLTVEDVEVDGNVADAKSVVTAFGMKAFDLSCAPLVRIRAVRPSQGDDLLLIAAHHSVLDGVSVAILLEEILSCYEAARTGQPLTLPPVTQAHGAYAREANERLRNGALDESKAYWRRQLSDLPPLELPLDRPRPDRRSGAGRSCTFELEPDLTRRLEQRARHSGVTVFSTLLAAFNCVVAQLTGQRDFAVATAIAGRDEPGCERVVGFCVNTVLLRCALGDDPSIADVQRATHETILAALEHGELPFDEVVKAMGDGGREPIRVQFGLQPPALPRAATDAAGWTAIEGNVDASVEGTAKFDLSLILAADGEGLRGSAQYDTDILSDDTVRRWLGYFRGALEELADDPDTTLAELSLLSTVERDEQLAITRTPARARRTVTQIFAEAAARGRDRIAVEVEGSHLRYGALDRSSTALAHRLRAQGVSPGDLVGLCARPSIELIVGMLGILKAGAAYVPLDPEYPRERLEYIAADAALRTVVVDGAGRTVDGLVGCTRVEVSGDDEPRLSGELPVVSPDDAAYVIYTSGSTGRPKGVVVTHDNVTRLFSSAARDVGFRSDDVWTLFHSYAFDFSVWEIWGALFHGGRLVVVPRSVARDPAAFWALVTERGVTRLSQTPSAFRELTEVALASGAKSDLVTVFFGGEALDPRMLAPWLERSSHGPRMVNMYGITETTVHVTYREITAADVRSGTSVIGRPLEDLQVVLLDEHGRPVPRGAPAEICVAGPGLAAGYLGRDELTAERFVEHPADATTRIYKSGDLARWLPNGELEYLGRVDDQLKIRGYRVEPGEVEAALGENEAVAACVVAPKADAAGVRRLVAYTVGRDGASPSATELRAHLSARLPSYMVPTSYVSLDALPKTPSGKVDRRSLPAPQATVMATRDFVAPRDEVETALCEVWQEVLGLPRVGVDDDFFEVGGDSILSIQLVSRARKRGVVLTPQQVFEHSTVAAQRAVADTTVLEPAQQDAVAGASKLTPIQSWFFAQDFEEPWHWNQSLQMVVTLDVSAADVAAAVAELVKQHDGLRLRFRRDADGEWQAWHGPASSSFQVTEHAVADDHARASAMASLERQLNLSEGPLLRVGLMRAGGELRLHVVCHHLVVDGVSWRVLLEDLDTLLRQRSRGEPMSIGPKTTSWQRWASGLRGYGHSDAIEATRAHWEATERACRRWRLAVDDDEGAMAFGTEEVVEVELPEDVTTALVGEANRPYRTEVNDLLLSGLVQAVRRWSGQAGLAVALEGHGREDVVPGLDLSRTVGWFTSLYPVALSQPEDNGDAVGARIKHIKEQLRQVPDRGLSHGLLRGSAGQRSCEVWPQLAFNYLGQVDGVARGLEFLRVLDEASGSQRSGAGARVHELEVVGLVREGRLRLRLAYGRERYRRTTVESLAHSYIDELTRVVAHCQSADAGGHVPSDFPLAQLNQAQLDDVVGREPLEDLLPLTSVQEGMLFHSQRSGDASLYFEQFGLELTGDVDPEVLEAAWNEVVDRHGALRTSLAWVGLPKPLQKVHAGLRLRLRRQRADSAAAFLAADRQRGFALDQAPLMRLSLVDLPDDRRLLVWSIHHAVIDGWSVPVVLEEVVAAYVALAKGQRPQLGTAPSYSRYHAWLATQQPSESYWRAYLSGFEGPTPWLSKGGATADPQTLRLQLAPPRVEALEAFARRHKLTVNTLVQGAWALVQGRYSGAQDVVYGVTASGRPAEVEGVERMVGVFINTLPLRVRIADADQAAVRWLSALQEQQSQQRTHETSSLAEVQGWSDVPAGTDLFETLLVFENQPTGQLQERQAELPWRIDRTHVFEQTHYPLAVQVERVDGLAFGLHYDKSRLAPATAAAMAEAIPCALEQLIADDARLGDIDVLTPKQRQRLVSDWNDTERPIARAPLHVLLRERMQAFASRPAVSGDGQMLSYEDLDQHANWLAGRLLDAGVRSGDVVGIHMARSPALIVSLLAVLQVGAAYLPLEIHDPLERTRAIFGDAGTRLVLVDPCRANLDVGISTRCVDELGRREAPPEAPTVDDTAPAYINYTSGSTGTPKGVVVPHRGVSRLVLGTKFVDLQGGRRIGQIATFAFDAATFEVWGALLHGGCVVVLPDPAAGLAALAAEIRSRAVDTMFVTTALFNEWVDADPDSLGGLEQLIVGGEAASVHHFVEFRRRYPDLRLVHAYGPTETTTFATTFDVPSQIDPAAPTIPIGHPIANTAVYLLDELGRLAPVGAVGEIYIGGLGVALGYIGRQAETQSRFVADPFRPAAKMYRTGDLARRRPDGALEFVGRADRQIKLRGHRIELPEVEAALRACPEVQDAVVQCRTVGGQRTLCGWVVLHDGAALDGVRSGLSSRVPSSMVPSALVPIEAVPLNRNGKVDSRALPDAEAFRAGLDDARVVPRTELERAIAGVWTQVLDVCDVGVTEDFFELGGNSLTSMRLAALLRAQLGLEVTVGQLLRNPTIEAQASALSDGLAPTAAPIPPRPRPDSAPLSFQQQRLWFLDRLHPGQSTYNIASAFRIHGDLVVEALRGAVELCIRRHESLRTTFAEHDGQPLQRIGELPALDLPVRRISGDDAEAREAHLQRELASLAERPFDLGDGPLVRVALFRVAERQHVLSLTLHHIVCDGWSMPLLRREVDAAYRALVDGHAPALPDIAVQYGDFAQRQRDVAAASADTPGLAFWAHQLQGIEPLPLPTIGPRPAVVDPAAGVVRFEVDGVLLDATTQMARQAGGTTFMALLAAFKVVLARYTGQSEICVGSPVANRGSEALQAIVGLFVNTLALRTEVSSATPLRQVFADVRKTCLDAFEHQDVPFEQVVQALGLARDSSRTPVFDVLLSLNDDQAGVTADFAGMRAENVSVGHRSAKFDLALEIHRGTDGLSCELVYRTSLFEASFARGVADSFVAVVQQLADAPTTTVSECALERGRSVALSPTMVGPTRNAPFVPVHEVFTDRATAESTRAALSFGDRTTAFGQLLVDSARVARGLVAHGVQRGDVVALALPPGPEAVVALLGVLRAGAAYLPVGFDQPIARLQTIVEAARPRLVIGHASAGLEVPTIDCEALRLAGGDAVGPVPSVGPDDLAYVIYTSGSTGTPKGVEVTHGALANHMAWMRETYPLQPDDVVLQRTRMTFDASVWELLAPLLAGARMVIAPAATQFDPAAMVRLIDTEGVSVLQVVPTLLGALVRSPSPSQGTLRQVFAGGEPLDVELAVAFATWCDAELINLYGPTEACIDTTHWRFDGSSRGTVALGRPIDNVDLYVLDAAQHEVPPGVVGELYISGRGLARGYRNDPAQTAGKFVELEDGARAYRTGDRVRVRGDGVLEFVGRDDDQVKIRGHRIELGEVEAALRSHPDVAEGAVGLATQGPGHQRLVAYTTGRDASPTAAELRAHLSARLPSYMVPTSYVSLAALPKTTSGKVDRRNLPAPQAEATATRDFVAPRDAVEVALCEVWQEVLGLQRVGVEDDFFEVGGDSILSIQLVSRARKRGISLTPQQVFEHSTVAAQRAVAGTMALEPAQQDAVMGPVELTPIQSWFFEQGFEQSSHWNQSLQMAVAADRSAKDVTAAVGDLVKQHDGLRLRFRRDEDGRWQQWHGSASSAVLVTEHTCADAESRLSTMTELQRELDLSEGPLVRIGVLQCEDELRVFIACHHLVVDGVSWRILLEDLDALLGQRSRTQSPSIGPKTTSFQRWSSALAAYGQSQAVAAERKYWASVERDCAHHRLPTDDADGANHVGSEESVEVELPQTVTRALVGEANRAYRTEINDLLLSGLAQAVQAWSGQHGVAVALEGHGREDFAPGLDVSRTVGWFTSLYPVVLMSPKDDGVGARIKAVKEQLRRIPDRGLGYGMLRQRFGRPDDGAWPQIGFNYLGQVDTVAEGLQYLRVLEESTGAERSEASARVHDLEVVGLVRQGRLRLRLLYGRHRYRRSTIESLARAYVEQLQTVVEHCSSDDAGGYVPSDFPLAQLNQAELDEVVGGEALEDLLPLTPVQEGMMFHSLRSPDSSLYFEQFGLELTGDVDPDVLEAAWNEVVRRHGALRTSLVWAGLPKPLQKVHEGLRLRLQRERSDSAEAFLRADRGRGLSLDEAPLMRLSLVDLPEGVQLLVWSIHHAVIDGWSVPVVLEEVIEAYASLARGQRPHFGPTAPSGRYHAWLAEQEPSEAYWRAYLAGFQGPNTWLSNGSPATEPETANHVVDPKQVAALEAFGRRHGLTMNTIVQGAWALVHSRYSGARDVVYGVTASGRPAELDGVERMVGVFINTLPLRVCAHDDEATVVRWLAALQDQQSTQRAHETSSLVQVQGWSDVPPGTELFDTLLVFENQPTGRLHEREAELPWRVARTHVFEQTHYPLTLQVSPDLEVRATYSPAPGNRERIKRALQALTHTLRTFVEAPHAPLSTLPPCSQDQLAKVRGWGREPAPATPPTFIPIHRRFAAQAEQTPERVAVASRHGDVSYAELARRVDRIANGLHRRGVAAGDIVALALPRTPDVIAAMLGVLELGAAYVPLDTKHPLARQAEVVSDARARWVLIDADASPAADTRAVRLSDLLDEAAGEPNIAVGEPTPEDLAYVLYTSGSSGKPKGVAIPHRGPSALVAWALHAYDPSVFAGVFAASSVTFDMSVFEIFVPLSCGGTVVLAEHALELGDHPHRDDITLINTVPSIMRELVGADAVPDGVAYVNLAGEALDADLVDQVYRTTNAKAVYDVYGPTETNCVTAALRLPGQQPTIGRPIAGAELLLLDESRRPVPVGAVGELYVAGPGVALGYLHAPEPTAERFVASDLVDSGLVYRTGDLARFLEDGQLAFLGRADSQVKVRGHRVELGEVEAALSRLSGLAAAAVTFVTKLGALVAHVVGCDRIVDAGDIKAKLRLSLPSYMVPEVVIALESLPLTPNGKIDRSKLVSLALEHRTSAVYEPPASDVEKKLAALWGEHLGVERVGRHDSFLELGGHSLSAMRLMGRVERELGIRVPLTILLQDHSLCEVAETVEGLLYVASAPEPDDAAENYEAVEL